MAEKDLDDWHKLREREKRGLVLIRAAAAALADDMTGEEEADVLHAPREVIRADGSWVFGGQYDFHAACAADDHRNQALVSIVWRLVDADPRDIEQCLVALEHFIERRREERQRMAAAAGVDLDEDGR